MPGLLSRLFNGNRRDRGREMQRYYDPDEEDDLESIDYHQRQRQLLNARNNHSEAHFNYLEGNRNRERTYPLGVETDRMLDELSRQRHRSPRRHHRRRRHRHSRHRRLDYDDTPHRGYLRGGDDLYDDEDDDEDMYGPPARQPRQVYFDGYDHQLQQGYGIGDFTSGYRQGYLDAVEDEQMLGLGSGPGRSRDDRYTASRGYDGYLPDDPRYGPRYGFRYEDLEDNGLFGDSDDEQSNYGRLRLRELRVCMRLHVIW